MPNRVHFYAKKKRVFLAEPRRYSRGICDRRKKKTQNLFEWFLNLKKRKFLPQNLDFKDTKKGNEYNDAGIAYNQLVSKLKNLKENEKKRLTDIIKKREKSIKDMEYALEKKKKEIAELEKKLGSDGKEEEKKEGKKEEKKEGKEDEKK